MACYIRLAAHPGSRKWFPDFLYSREIHHCFLLVSVHPGWEHPEPSDDTTDRDPGPK